MATQNPYEHGRLPDRQSQLDASSSRSGLDYGTEESELNTLNLPHRSVIPDMISDVSRSSESAPFWSPGRRSTGVYVPDEVALTVVKIVRATRENQRIELGTEPAGFPAS